MKCCRALALGVLLGALALAAVQASDVAGAATGDADPVSFYVGEQEAPVSVPAGRTGSLASLGSLGSTDMEDYSGLLEHYDDAGIIPSAGSDRRTSMLVGPRKFKEDQFQWAAPPIDRSDAPAWFKNRYPGGDANPQGPAGAAADGDDVPPLMDQQPVGPPSDEESADEAAATAGPGPDHMKYTGAKRSTMIRWEIPAARFEGVNEEDMVADRLERDDPVWKRVGKAASNSIRSCFSRYHSFRTAARAWDVIVALAAARSPWTLMTASRLAEKTRTLFLDYLVVVGFNSRQLPAEEQSSYFVKHCKLSFSPKLCSNPELAKCFEGRPGPAVAQNLASMRSEQCTLSATDIEDLVVVDIFGSDPKKHATVAGAVGSDPRVLAETFKEGNLRELLTLAFMRERALAPVLVYMLEHREAVERLELASRAVNFGFIREQCSQDPAANGCSPTTKNLNRILWAQTENYWVYRNNVPGYERGMRPKDESGAKPKGVTLTELTYLSSELSPREEAFITAANGGTLDGVKMTPWETGGQKWQVDPQSDFGRASWSSYLNTVAGPSGTTARTMMTAKFLGFNEQELYVLRLALVGYLVPWQHSLLEVMLGSAEFVTNTVLEPAAIHLSMLPTDFSIDIRPDQARLDHWGGLHGRFNLEVWNAHVRKVAENMRGGDMLNEMLEYYDPLGAPQIVYDYMVYDLKTFTENDPRALVTMFYNKPPSHYLTKNVSEYVVDRCYTYVLLGVTLDGQDPKSVDTLKPCYEADRRLSELAHYQSPMSEIIDTCGLTPETKGCVFTFPDSDKQDKWDRALQRFQDPAMKKAGKMNIARLQMRCVPAPVLLPNSIKSLLPEGVLSVEVQTAPKQPGGAPVAFHTTPRVEELDFRVALMSMMQWRVQWRGLGKMWENVVVRRKNLATAGVGSLGDLAAQQKSLRGGADAGAAAAASESGAAAGGAPDEDGAHDLSDLDVDPLGKIFPQEQTIGGSVDMEMDVGPPATVGILDPESMIVRIAALQARSKNEDKQNAEISAAIAEMTRRFEMRQAEREAGIVHKEDDSSDVFRLIQSHTASEKKVPLYSLHREPTQSLKPLTSSEMFGWLTKPPTVSHPTGYLVDEKNMITLDTPLREKLEMMPPLFTHPRRPTFMASKSERRPGLYTQGTNSFENQMKLRDLIMAGREGVQREERKSGDLTWADIDNSVDE